MSDVSFQGRRDEARRFLDLLWGNCTRSGDLGLFFLPGFRSLHIPSNNLDDAAHEIAQASLIDGSHVYMNTCLLSETCRGKPGRGGAADALMIAGIWADVDIAGPAHKSDVLPPDRETALEELCMAMVLPPTLVVDSGHGLYPWWLFDKPRRLADEDGRDRAHRLVQATQLALSELGERHGWSLDHTADLARILRPPGTVNWKLEDDPRAVHILHEGGERYSPAQLTEAWGAFAPQPKGPATPLPDRITAGNRTNSVASLAGTLRRRNVVEEAAMVAALEHNRLVCDPPLPSDKVRETVRGIYTRYEPEGPALANGKARVAAPAGPARLKPFSEIEPRPIEFIWEPMIPRGGLVLLAGDPGMGKGLIASALTASVTTGAPVPGKPVVRGEVLWVSYEENESYAIRPRLDAAGADVSRVHKIVIPREDGEDRFFRSADLPILTPILAANAKICLIVLDPVLSYIGASYDINQGNQVRAALEPLVGMADDLGIGLLGIAHINKSDLTKVLYRVSNSVAFVAMARSVLGVGELEDGRRCLAHIKANNTIKADAVPYTITGVRHALIEQSVGRIIWESPDREIDTAQIFRDRSQRKDKGPTKAEECGKVIKELLKDGPGFVSVIKATLTQQGFSKEAIEMGRYWAGLVLSGGGPGARWHLPPGNTPTPMSETTESDINLAESSLRQGGVLHGEGSSEDRERGDV